MSSSATPDPRPASQAARPDRAAGIFTRDEIRALTAPSDLAGFAAIAVSWAIIVGTFAALARWPHPATFVAAVVLLGGRQLALAILMHEAAHRSLFKRRFLNDVLADWLCARPVWGDVARYRRHHLEHHAHTSTERDPDLSLATSFPVTRASLARKLARDILGISGVRRAIGLLFMDLGLLDYNVGGDAKRLPWKGVLWHARIGAKHLAGFVVTNAVMALVLAAVGHVWVYSAWAVAYLTTFGLYLRIRSIAEHACLEVGPDLLRNTRTTRAGWLAKLTVAPLNVSFHLEHHLLPTVPYFRLPQMELLLAAKGIVPKESIAPGYLAVLAAAASKRAT